jgi:hypothetical protein
MIRICLSPHAVELLLCKIARICISGEFPNRNRKSEIDQFDIPIPELHMPPGHVYIIIMMRDTVYHILISCLTTAYFSPI